MPRKEGASSGFLSGEVALLEVAAFGVRPGDRHRGHIPTSSPAGLTSRQSLPELRTDATAIFLERIRNRWRPESQNNFRCAGVAHAGVNRLLVLALCGALPWNRSWRHRIAVKRVTRSNTDWHYPLCTGGARAAPPNDVGGPPGGRNPL